MIKLVHREQFWQVWGGALGRTGIGIGDRFPGWVRKMEPLGGAGNAAVHMDIGWWWSEQLKTMREGNTVTNGWATDLVVWHQMFDT